MSKYEVIKAATNAYIKTNGRREITGAILNAVMIATIDSLGKFYQFVGRAEPDTDPGVIDQNIAYLAGTPGTYEHLGGFTLDAGELAVIKFDGEWHKEAVATIPAKVSQLQNDLGFITNAVSDLVNYYTKGETFSKAEVQGILLNYYDRDEVDSIVSVLTRQSYVVAWDGTAEPVVGDIPAGVSVSWGGNTYVGTLPASASTIGRIYLVSNGAGYDEYITTEDGGYSWISIGTTSIDLSDYATKAEVNQLEQELTFSKAGVEQKTLDISSFTLEDYSILATGFWGTYTTYKHITIPIENETQFLVVANASGLARIAFLASISPATAGGEIAIVLGTSVIEIPAGKERGFDIPEGTAAIAVNIGQSPSYTYQPSAIKIGQLNLSYITNRIDTIEQDVVRIDKKPVDLSSYTVVYYYINSSGNWTSNGYHRSLTIPVFPGQRYQITANDSYPAVYAFLTSTARTAGDPAPLVAGTTIVTIPKGKTAEVIIPPTCLYINFRCTMSQAEYNENPKLRCPSSFVEFKFIQEVVKELEIKRANLLVRVTGEANDGVYSTRVYDIIGGYSYRLHLLNPDVSMSGVSANQYTLSVYFDAGETLRLATSNNPFNDTYDFLVPEGAKYMYFGVRCAMGAEFGIDIEQLGEALGGAITALNPESEFIPKFMSAKKRYYTSSDTTEPTPLVLLHISDIHGNWANVERYLKFADHYASYIDELIDTGDIVTDDYDDGIEGYAALPGIGKVMNVIGNHDSSRYEGGVRSWQYYCGLPCYETFIAPFVSEWGVTQPDDADVNGYCYYYKDYSAKHIRLVVVDIMAYDATQDAWLKDLLDDAIDNGLHILIATHFAGSTAPGHGDDPAFTKVPCNYTSLYSLGSSTSLLNSYNPSAYLMMQSVQDFIEGGGHFAGYIQGHYHADFVAKVADYPQQMIYSIGSSKSGEVRDYKHTIGTRMQDEFQIVAVDTKNTIVKLFKVGANYDRYGRSKGSVCVNYTTGEVLGEGL